MLRITFLMLLASLAGGGVLYYKFKTQEKFIYSLQSMNGVLEDNLSEAQSKIEELEETNAELQDRLSQISALSKFTYPSRPNYSTNTASYGPISGAMETRIDGEFEGWEGETIFKMMDGTIWQQEDYAYTYHYAYSPKVVLYNKNGSTYMQVEDMDESIRVRRIK